MRAVIFDSDGVLVNSEPLHRVAWEEIFRPRGIAVPEADYTWGIGRRDVTFAEVIIRKFSLNDTPEALTNEKHAVLHKLLATESKTFEGGPKLVRQLATTHPLGLTSSATRAEVESVLKRFELNGLFRAIVTGEDVRRHKPHPEPYLLCAARLGVEPGNCIVFEDSVTGIESARAAGMRVIAFTSTFPAEKLSAADAVIDSLADTDAVAGVVESLARAPG